MARRQAKYFERLGGGLARGGRAHGLGSFVFTFPAAWRMKMGPAQIADARRWVVRCMETWAAYCFKGARFGYLVCFHPEGDLEPGVWKPHFHVVMTLQGLRNGKRTAIAWKRTTAELASLRWHWGLLHGRMAEVAGWPSCGANVRYGFRESKEQRLHGYGYDARPFPIWASSGRIWEWGTKPNSTVRRLLVPRVYGLAAPRCAAPGIERWRDAVRGELDHQEEADGLKCPACSKLMKLQWVCGHYDGANWTYAIHLPQWEEARPPPAERRKQPPPFVVAHLSAKGWRVVAA